MTTGVDNYDEIRWTMRAIKKERGLTPAGENVKIDIDRLTNRDPDAPAMDTVRKCIRLLESQGAFRVEKKYFDDRFAVYDTGDADWELATNFELAINQETFDILYEVYTNKPKRTDLKSNDATDFGDERARIGKIQHVEDHKIELERWIEIKRILDAIHRQLSPMAGCGQTVSVGLKQTHKNISQTLLEDLWDRGICRYGGGAPSPELERMYYLHGSLIQVQNLERFNEYRNGVSDLVKWIENDIVTRFSKIRTDYHAYKSVGVSEKVLTDQDANKPTFKFSRQSELPSGTDWPSFTFQFLDEENVLVTIRDIKEKLSYADMGFKDKRKSEKWPPYDSQWRLLLDLAACGGEIEPNSQYAKPDNEKAKEKLTNKLQTYFSIHYDPFWKVEYSKKGEKKKGSYKTRMTLIPPPPESKSVEREDELTKEIRQDYSNQTPSL